MVKPDRFEFQPNQTVSTWKCLTAFFGESTEVTDEAIMGLPLDEIFVRAKVSKSTKTDGIFRIKIQWILEPGRVRCWDRVSSSFAKTGTLLELPSDAARRRWRSTRLISPRACSWNTGR